MTTYAATVDFMSDKELAPVINRAQSSILRKRYADDENDWITGEYGYIRSPNPNASEESAGEFVVSIAGSGRLAGWGRSDTFGTDMNGRTHEWGKVSVMPVSDWKAEVQSWAHQEGVEGKAAVERSRIFPDIGLE